MEIVDYLLARKKAGGGSDVTIEQLSVTENGTYSEQGIAYSPVVVNVPVPENSYQLTDLPTGTVSAITDGTDLPMPSLKVGIEPVQEGSGDPSPENIRPITGWTAANVTRTGKNLWNTDDIDAISVGVAAIRNGLYFRKPGQYTVSAQNSGNYLYCRIFNADGTIKITYFIVSLATITNTTFTISDGEYFAVYDALEGTINISKTRFNSWLCQVELGSTATTYEPYNGQTYNIQFKDGDNPLTVYGGTLDVTTGELVVDRVNKTYTGASNESWITISQGFYIEELTMESGAYINGLSNWLKTAHNINDESSISITFGTQYKVVKVNHITDNISAITDVASWKTYLSSNNLTVNYPLATPTTYHLTPAQVRTLVGNNNIWADTGDVLSGKYFKEL